MTLRDRTSSWCAAVVVLQLTAGSVAWAVQPGVWLHTTEADFEPGERDGTVVTNLGDVKLAAATEVIAELPEDASIVYDMLAGADGAIYLAAGPDAKLLVRKVEKVEELASLPGEQVFCLDRVGDSVLVGISAEGKSRLAMLHDGKLVDIVTLADVRYVWDLAVSGNDVFVATGTEGQVVRVADVAGYAAAVRAGERAEPPAFAVVLDAAPANVLCLGVDGERRVYAGTDGDGLVYRLTPDAHAETGYVAFVVYDAAEPEVGAILVAADGTLYVGTADAEQAKPGRLEQAAEQEGGRPGAPAAGEAEAPREPGDGDDGDAPAPEPGDLPQVPPKAPPVGEPDGEGAATVPDDEPADVAVPQGMPASERAADRAIALNEPAPDVAAVPAAAPSPEQYDRLRAVIRQRLEQARKTGALQAGRPMGPQTRRAAGGPRPGPAASPNAPPPKEGNAIYRIDTSGFVTEVFRESVMILRLAETDNGQLIVATGNEGQVYRVNPAADETTTLTDLDAQQVLAILPGPDGSLILGTANPATLVRLADGFDDNGQYTSVVLDAGQISLWGKLKVTGDVPLDTTVTVQTRSGNVANVEDAGWSPWSDAGKFAHDPNLPASITLEPREIAIASPPARFLQYRLALASDGTATPTVSRLQLAYVTPNLRPGITSITAAYPDAPPPGGPAPAPAAGAPPEAPATAMAINWEAADPNNDRLLHALEYQPAGSPAWLPLADDLDANTYEWQTRLVPDGRYLIRVTASDSPDNPPDMAKAANRVSDPVVVDNTPPAFEDLEHRRDGDTLTLRGAVRDALLPIRAITATLDGEDRPQAVLPDDLIFDSTRETFSVTLTGLSPGPHVVTLRAADTRGNPVYHAVLVD